ncbi:sodium/proline symporter [Thalassotalea fusca]
MDYQTTVLITLIVYKVLLIGIGLWSNKRAQNTEEFFIGGRSLGPWVAAISAAASASSAWSLLGMSGAAYFLGVSAIWIVPSVILGYCFNWLWLAPRIQRAAKHNASVTLTDFITYKASSKKAAIIWLCTFCIVISFAFYIAAQFQAAGTMFSETFNMSANTSILLGTIIILIYTLLGGFWAVSLTDTLQGILMVATAVLLPVAAIITIGGFDSLWQQMQLVYSPTQLSWFGEHQGINIIAFIIGTLGIGLANPGQPHVVNRLMALRDEKAVRQGKYIGIGWSVVIFVSMLIVGWSARVLLVADIHHEQAMISLAQQLFPPVLAGVVVAATLSAIMSTADSQLLVAASAVSYDIGSGSQKASMFRSKLTVALMCVISMLIAMWAPQDIFTRVLFAWNALGAAFGPVVIVLLMNRTCQDKYLFSAILIGFCSTVIFHWLPSPPGDVIERVLPFILAFACAWVGSAPNTSSVNRQQNSLTSYENS